MQSMPPMPPARDLSVMTTTPTADALTLYGETFASRVLLGTSRYPSLQSLSDSIDAARPGMITVALRRQMNEGAAAAGFFELLKRHGVPLLPNTAGCLTVNEAVTTAHMAREVFETDWIKLELIGDDYTLQPDPVGLIEAAARPCATASRCCRIARKTS
jgi:thiazole synthase